jgi:hypothetical protein
LMKGIQKYFNHHFWNWEPWGGVISAIALQWQF